MLWGMVCSPSYYMYNTIVLQWYSSTEILFWQRQVSKEECLDYQCSGHFKSMLEVSLVLVQHRKTHPCLNERLLMGLIESNQTNKQICLKYAGFTFTYSSCGDGTLFMAGVPTVNSTSHNKAPLLTCHDSSSCRASRTVGLRLKNQVKVGR